MAEEATKMEVGRPVDRAPINIDITGGILPHTYSELLQFAALYKASGLAPKSFQTTEQLAIAIGMCIELDRPILTGIQDMAVINGHVSIYGDAALAIVRRSGLLEYIIEEETGKPYADDWRFTCELKRKGSPKPRMGIWTWEDAKRAGFDDPRTRDGSKDTFSPWRRFTRRMMQFKARNFPLRDEFGDVIKGMTLAEDAQDIIDVTPAPALKIEGRTEPAPGEDPYRVQEPSQGKEEAPGPETPEVQAKRKRRTKAEIEAEKKAPETITEPPPADPPQNSIEPEDPPTAFGDHTDDPGPVEEAPLFPTTNMAEDDKAFMTEAENYWDAILGHGKAGEVVWGKILGVFDGVKSHTEVKKARRGSFLSTCRAQLEKLNAGNGK